MSLTLDDFLQGLGAEGRVDSAGKFTMDRAKAAEKLRRFQLPDPYFYCLKWLQAGVAGGAKAFHWSSNTVKAVAEMPGLALPLDELPNVLLHLLDDARRQSNRPLYHLSVGVNAAVGTRAAALHLQSWDGRQGIQVSWRSAQRQDVVPWRPPRDTGPLTRLELSRAPGDVLREIWDNLHKHHVQDMLSGGAHARDREQTALHERACLCPLEVTINQKPVDPFRWRWQSAPLSFWERLKGLLMLKPDHAFRLERYFPRAYPGSAGFKRLPHPLAFRTVGEPLPLASMYLALSSHPAGVVQVHLIVDGVVMNVCRLQKAHNSGAAICDAGSLNTDLSTFQFTEDDRWRELEALIHQRLEDMQDYSQANVNDEG